MVGRSRDSANDPSLCCGVGWVMESKSVRTIDSEQRPVNEVPFPQTSFIIRSDTTGRLISNRMDIQVSLTERLQSFSGGDREIAEAVLRQVLPKLHQIAVRELRRERYVAPLSPTELIHEVWLAQPGQRRLANQWARALLRHRRPGYAPRADRLRASTSGPAPRRWRQDHRAWMKMFRMRAPTLPTSMASFR